MHFISLYGIIKYVELEDQTLNGTWMYTSNTNTISQIFKETKMSNNNLPAGYSVIDNATIKEVRENQYNGYDLIAETVSPLTNSVIEQRVPLYMTDFKTHEVSDDVIANTEKQLREVLGDDTITFHATPDANDKTDIVNWAKEHAGSPIKALYVHDGKIRISAPRSDNQQTGERRSFWLRSYREEYGAYDPEQYYVPFIEAQTEEDQEAIKNLDTKSPHISESKFRNRKNTTFFGEGVIQDVFYTSGADFNTKTEDKDMPTIYAMISATLAQDAPEVLVPKESQDADKALAKEIDKLGADPENGLYALYAVLGGYRYLNNVSDQRRDPVKQILSKQNIKVVSMYIRTATGKVFQLSVNPTRKLDLSNPRTHGLHIEFLGNDFKSNDVLFALVEGGIVDDAEVLEIAKAQGVYNADENRVILPDMPAAMDFLRAIFKDKVVRYRSVIADDRGPVDHSRLGSNFISARNADDKDVKVEAPVENEVTDSPVVDDTTPTTDDPFADVQTPAEDEADPEVGNPFAPKN